MHALIIPGKAIVNRLSYPHKFLLISALFIAPLALAIGLLFSETLPRIAFAENELAGSTYLRPLHRLLDAVLTDKLLAQRVAQGDSDAREPLTDNRRRITDTMRELQLLDGTLGQRLGTTTALSGLTSSWRALEQEPLGPDQAALDTRYEAVIRVIHDLFTTVGNQSNLILDPALETYYLMDAVLLKLPAQAELLGRAEAPQGSAPAPDEQRGAIVIAGLLRQSANDLSTGYEVVFTTAPQAAPALRDALGRYRSSADAVLAIIDQQGDATAQPEASGAALAGASATARRAGFELWDLTVIELDRLLQERVDGMRQKNILACGVALLLFGIVLYLLAAFYRSVMDTVAALNAAAQRMVAGDFSGSVTLANRDELGQVVHSFNTVAAALVQTSAERASAEAARTQLQQEVIQSQQTLLEELSAPLIPITDRVLVMPLVGTLDAARIERLTATLANGIAERRAHTVILDVTGVAVITNDAVAGLVRATEVARVLGARIMVTGMSAELAQNLILAQIDLGAINVHRNLQSGIAATLVAAETD